MIYQILLKYSICVKDLFQINELDKDLKAAGVALMLFPSLEQLIVRRTCKPDSLIRFTTSPCDIPAILTRLTASIRSPTFSSPQRSAGLPGISFPGSINGTSWLAISASDSELRDLFSSANWDLLSVNECCSTDPLSTLLLLSATLNSNSSANLVPEVLVRTRRVSTIGVLGRIGRISFCIVLYKSAVGVLLRNKALLPIPVAVPIKFFLSFATLSAAVVEEFGKTELGFLMDLCIFNEVGSVFEQSFNICTTSKCESISMRPCFSGSELRPSTAIVVTTSVTSPICKRPSNQAGPFGTIDLICRNSSTPSSPPTIVIPKPRADFKSVLVIRSPCISAGFRRMSHHTHTRYYVSSGHARTFYEGDTISVVVCKEIDGRSMKREKIKKIICRGGKDPSIITANETRLLLLCLKQQQQQQTIPSYGVVAFIAATFVKYEKSSNHYNKHF
uniref:Uncharacterized protein n=1 Tax=Glossina brevipalpis TaxID=37001 RepID=A0A1A9W3N6_9MUSC